MLSLSVAKGLDHDGSMLLLHAGWSCVSGAKDWDVGGQISCSRIGRLESKLGLQIKTTHTGPCHLLLSRDAAPHRTYDDAFNSESHGLGPVQVKRH